MTKPLSNKLFMKRNLYTLRMTIGSKIHDHLNTFNDLVSQLICVDAKLDDEEKAIALLYTLLDSWDHLITFTSFSNPKSFDYDTIVATLLLEKK